MIVKDVIIALDFPSELDSINFLEKFGHSRPYVKVGMELFYSQGPRLVRILKNRGHSVFLDLKLHDIPNTVAGGMRSIASLGADMVNLHASGGSEMMKRALGALGEGGGERPILLAVTQMTSTSRKMLNEELGIQGEVEDSVIKLARLARESGMDGVVCSPLEGSAVKLACGESFLTVTPGIRYPDALGDDQSRVTTPAMARQGSDYIVVGRPITRAADPLAAYERICADFLEG